MNILPGWDALLFFAGPAEAAEARRATARIRSKERRISKIEKSFRKSESVDG